MIRRQAGHRRMRGGLFLLFCLNLFLCSAVFSWDCDVGITISVTEGEPFDTVSGTVTGVDPNQVWVVLFARSWNRWWIQPLDTNFLIEVGPDGGWQTWTHEWNQLAVFVIRRGYDPLAHYRPYGPFPLRVDCDQILSVEAFPSITWANRTFAIKAGSGLGPSGDEDGNVFSASSDNVWVDDLGRLHLRLTYREGEWRCAEIVLLETLGYGTYHWTIASDIDDIPEDVIASPFIYQDMLEGEPPRELDIEFSRWGDPKNPNAQFVVHPDQAVGHREQFDMVLEGEFSSHLISWAEGEVFFRSAQGHLPPADNQIIHQWRFASDKSPSEGLELMHINLWLLDDSVYSGPEVELIVSDFQFWKGHQGIVAGPGPGPNQLPLIRVGHEQWLAYGGSQGGVNVASGDLDGDGEDEILTGPGPVTQYGPHVRAFKSGGVPLPQVSFMAYGTPRYGVNVAAGDIDGDGFDEIITGAGPGAVFGPHVRAFNYDGGPVVAPVTGVSFFAYGTNRYGVNVAAGDVDGDGFDEIVTGAGPGAVFGAHVRGWNVDGGAAVAIPQLGYFAYGTPRWGVNVTCGDIDGDGMDEIITGPGPGIEFGPHVRAWDYDGLQIAAITGVSFFAYANSTHGVVVSTGDLNADGTDEILTMPGPAENSPALVRAWKIVEGTVYSLEYIQYDAFADHGYSFGGKVTWTE